MCSVYVTLKQSKRQVENSNCFSDDTYENSGHIKEI